MEFLLMVTCASATMFFFVGASYIIAKNKREKREHDYIRISKEW